MGGNAGGERRTMTLADARAMVDRHPYYHFARLQLLRMLYEQRDPDFNDELRRSALYLPSRETIFDFVEARHMKPAPEEPSSIFFGATQARKANGRLATTETPQDDDRTETLIDTFLNRQTTGLPHQAAPAPQRRGRADATVDYIAYMLAEEEALAEQQKAAQEAMLHTRTTDTDGASTLVNNSASSVMDDEASSVVGDEAASVVSEGKVESQQEKIDNFIQSQGDRRIRLKDKKDSELQKPVLDVDNSPSEGTFTETLAKIYIKQGKFEHAIEIIRRLSLKYPKKNRYFADQIRFLEKLIANQQAMKR